MPAEANREAIELEWAKELARECERRERMRQEASPTPAEIVQAWISAAKGATWLQDSVMAVSFETSFPAPITAEQSDDEDKNLPETFPDIKRITRPNYAAGDRQQMFFSQYKAQIFAAFEARLIRSPSNRIVRAAAIAFYWQLATYIPGSYEIGTFYDDDDGTAADRDFWVNDDDPGYLPIRRLYTSILGIAASYGKVSQIASWTEAQWEFRNAYAASDWPRVREILDHLERRALKAPVDLSVLRLQFEGLLILGPYADALSPMLKDATDNFFHWSELQGPFFNSMSLEHCNVEPDIFGSSDRTFQPEMALMFLPLFLTIFKFAPPIVPLGSRATILELLSQVEAHYNDLPQRGLIQRALAGFLYESMGEQHRAATQYSILAKEYDDLHASGLPLMYSAKYVETLHMAGETTEAIKAFRAIPKDKCRPLPYAKLAVSLGLLEEARAILANLDTETRDRLDPILKAALVEDDGLPFRKSEEKCRQWGLFGRLTPKAQDTWLWATFSSQAKRQAEAIQREAERIAVEQYGRTVELELSEVFSKFKVYAAKHRDRWKDDLLGDRLLREFLQGSSIALGQMQTVLQKVARNGGQGEINRLLQRFLKENHPGLSVDATIDAIGKLRVLGELTTARNEACHNITQVKPDRAREQARTIIEAIHVRG